MLQFALNLIQQNFQGKMLQNMLRPIKKECHAMKCPVVT